MTIQLSDTETEAFDGIIAARDTLSGLYYAVRLEPESIRYAADLHEHIEELANWCRAIQIALVTHGNTGEDVGSIPENGHLVVHLH